MEVLKIVGFDNRLHIEYQFLSKKILDITNSNTENS